MTVEGDRVTCYQWNIGMTWAHNKADQRGDCTHCRTPREEEAYDTSGD
jgi:hypothetical protein